MDPISEMPVTPEWCEWLRLNTALSEEVIDRVALTTQIPSSDFAAWLNGGGTISGQSVMMIALALQADPIMPLSLAGHRDLAVLMSVAVQKASWVRDQEFPSDRQRLTAYMEEIANQAQSVVDILRLEASLGETLLIQAGHDGLKIRYKESEAAESPDDGEQDS